MPRRLLVPLALPALAACTLFSGYFEGITPGLGESEVVARVGAPQERRPVPGGGYVLEYPREPLGEQNWRITLGPDGRVAKVEQLIDEAGFTGLKPGMTEDQVLLALGRISERSAYPNLGESVLSWRYTEFGHRMMFFNAHFDAARRLKYTSRTPDPAQQAVETGS